MHSSGQMGGSGCEGINITDVRGSGSLNYRDQLSVSTWNCGGLSFTVRENLKDFCDIRVLTETHDNGTLKCQTLHQRRTSSSTGPVCWCVFSSLRSGLKICHPQRQLWPTNNFHPCAIIPLQPSCYWGIYSTPTSQRKTLLL